MRRFIDGCVNGVDLDVIDQTWSHDMSWHGGSLATYQRRDACNRRKVAPGSHVLRTFNLVGDRAAVADDVFSLRFLPFQAVVLAYESGLVQADATTEVARATFWSSKGAPR